MPDPKATPELPNRATHGDRDRSSTPDGGNPKGFPTSERQDTETAHHEQHEERPGESAGGKSAAKKSSGEGSSGA
jgi:hypothetical protein